MTKQSFAPFLLSLSLLAPLAAACSSADVSPKDSDGDGDTDSVESDVKAGKKKLSCAAVFGTCVGLSPSSCVGGTWADASIVSCGGGLGVGCCVRPTPPPPPPPPPVEPCPTLSPPHPDFCAGGTITPKKDTSGCTVGHECVLPPPAKSACELGGGTCVGLAPSSCPSGTWADASTHGCGGGLGVGCCLP